jgi:hypothetical protein
MDKRIWPDLCRAIGMCMIGSYQPINLSTYQNYQIKTALIDAYSTMVGFGYADENQAEGYSLPTLAEDS